ncbi:MAG: hypothetical protein JNM84_05740 [Planctomycetes bacterium]|nr:hypothetical protein [Planctomycetota bacterium]
MYVYAEIVGERILALWSFEGGAFQMRFCDEEQLRPMDLAIPRLASGSHPAPVAPFVTVDETGTQIARRWPS